MTRHDWLHFRRRYGRSSSRRSRSALLLAPAITLAALLAAPLTAPAAQDSLSLATAHRLAEASDPRAVQREIVRRQSALRQGNLEREWLPTLNGVAGGTYLSDVARVDGLPGGVVAGPLQQQYDAYVSARQLLFDPTRGARGRLEDAQLAEADATVASTLWQQRAAVNEAFFSALRAGAQRAVTQAAVDDLNERLRVARERVAAGVSLPSEAMALEAERLRREQLLVEATQQESAAREILGLLTGRAIGLDTELLLPDLSPGLPQEIGARPEFEQFAAARTALAERDRALGAQRLPRVVAVGRAGYGRPGLNPLGRDFDSYYTVGLQVEWMPFTWGATDREREIQRLQQQSVSAQEAAFAEAIARAATAERATVAALRESLAADSAIIALREAVLRETRLRYDEGDVTAAEYVQRLTEALTATLDRDLRRIRLAEAQSRYLTTIGREVR